MTSLRDLAPGQLATIVQRVCTPHELEALHLKAQGLGIRSISRSLGISRSATKDRLSNAHRKIQQALNEEAT